MSPSRWVLVALRPIHDRVMVDIDSLGDFEIAPKKAYLSLRRKKQFAMVGPATKTHVKIGLNAKQLEAGGRLIAQKPGGMCQYKVRLAVPDEVDDDLVGWIRAAYDEAGGEQTTRTRSRGWPRTPSRTRIQAYDVATSRYWRSTFRAAVPSSTSTSACCDA